MQQQMILEFLLLPVKFCLVSGSQLFTRMLGFWYRLWRAFMAAERQFVLDESQGRLDKPQYPPSRKEVVLPQGLSKCTDIPCEVMRYFEGFNKATDQGNLSLGTFNFEFLNLEKAEQFLPAYIELIERHHLLLCVEVEEKGLKYLAEACGYSYYISKGNARNQAVGILIHPRLSVSSVVEHASVASIPGTKHMRPALVASVMDCTSGLSFSAAVVHLKSLRGGQTRTSTIRRLQIEALVSSLGADYQGIVGGDFNCFLENTEDTNRLLESGFRLIYPGDTAATQSMGGRLDGIFYSAKLGLVAHLSRYQVRSFWRNRYIGRAFSDHSLVSAMMKKRGHWH